MFACRVLQISSDSEVADHLQIHIKALDSDAMSGRPVLYILTVEALTFDILHYRMNLTVAVARVGGR